MSAMSEPSDEKQVLPMRYAFIVAIILVLSYFINLYLFIDNDWVRISNADVLTLIANILATLCLIYGAYHSRYNRNLYIAWTLLALAQLIYTIGDSIWVYLEVVKHEAPFPSIADGFYLTYYPIFALGILLMPKVPLTSTEKLKVLLDIGIVMIPSSLLFWTFIIAPNIESNAQSDLITWTASVAYPVGDLILAFALIELLFRRIKSVSVLPIVLLIASLAFLIIADTFYYKAELVGTNINGGLTDAGWLIAWAFAGLAGISRAHLKKIDFSRADLESEAVEFNRAAYLPYIFMGFSYILLIWSYYHPIPTLSFYRLSWAVGAIITLFIIRQAIAFKDNIMLYKAKVKENVQRKKAEEEVRKLNDELENRVFERTRQLESANIELTTEIKERKHAESALRESEERYRLISENMSDVVSLTSPDPDIHLLFITSSVKVIGYTPEELIGKSPIGLLIHPDDTEKFVQGHKMLIDRKIQVTAEYRVKAKDGSLRWAETVSKPIIGSSGKVEYIQTSIRDITTRKQAEEALRDSQQLMSNIIDFLPDAIMAVDMDGKVMIWNREMENLTKVKSEHMIDRGNYEHSIPFYGFRRPILVDLVLKPQKDFETEYFGFQMNGNVVVGEAYIPSFGPHGSYLLGKASKLCDASGNVIGAIESVRDMTDRRLMEQKWERTRTELQIAADIQRSFIPENTPVVPGFDIAAVTIPAMEVGGDFYDFIMLSKNRYGVVIADVAGKSVPAAIFMALSRTIIRANALNQKNISNVLSATNKMIESDARGGIFVTSLYGIVDNDNLLFRYSNAGHPPPLVFRLGKCMFVEEKVHGIALGVTKNVDYLEKTILLSPGDIIVLYTDGVTEAMNNQGELYGQERLIRLMSSLYQKSAQGIIKGVLEDIKSFSGDIEKHDDLTLIVIKAVEQSGNPQRIISIAHENEIPGILSRIEEAMRQSGFSDEENLNLQLAIEEACINIIKHGYQGAEGYISITLEPSANSFTAIIEDEAPQFDPTQFAKPNLAGNIEDRPIGGLGIHLIKSLIDELTYEYVEGKNRLSLKKNRSHILMKNK